MEAGDSVPEEEKEAGQKAEDGPYWHPMGNAGHNDAADDGNPQRFQSAEPEAIPVQKMSLKEKLAAFKEKADEVERGENQGERGKDILI